MYIPFNGQAKPYVDCVADFLSCIENDGTPRSDAVQGVKNMAVLDAAIKSVETGRFEPTVAPEI